jgi:hypothetical protein
MTIRALWPVVGLVAVLVLLSTTGAGAAVASNHAVFSDRIGDVTGAPRAPDIVSLEATSGDNGDVDLKLTLNEVGATFYIGDDIEIWIDNDQNPNNGVQGFDAALVAQGIRDTATSGHMKYTLCSYDNPTTFSCSDYDPSDISRQQIGANTHTLTFGLQTSWHVVNIVAFAGYPNPADPTKTIFDRAPDSGSYQFDVRADADNDGVAGFADQCPRFPGGKFDSNGDGCPPFYPIPSFTFSGARSGSGFYFTKMAVPNAPPGATVTVRLAGATLRRRGPGAVPRAAGRRLGIGARVTFIYSNPNYFGGYKVARVTPTGLSVIGHGCTVPGKLTFIDCKKVKG